MGKKCSIPLSNFTKMKKKLLQKHSLEIYGKKIVIFLIFLPQPQYFLTNCGIINQFFLFAIGEKLKY